MAVMKMSEILLNMDKVRAQHVCGDLSAVIISLASVRKRCRLRGNPRSQAGMILLSHSDSLGNGSSENSLSNPRSTHITAIMIFSAADLDYGLNLSHGLLNVSDKLFIKRLIR